ncbi:MAG: hypothetical protein WED00_18435 [Aquisalimonadaceae bacterium]
MPSYNSKAEFLDCVGSYVDITAREYEIATGWDFDTEDEYRGHLRTLWNIFYPGESPDDHAGCA